MDEADDTISTDGSSRDPTAETDPPAVGQRIVMELDGPAPSYSILSDSAGHTWLVQHAFSAQPPDRGGEPPKRLSDNPLVMSRKQRARLRQESQRRVDKDMARRQQPGSNLPPITEADIKADVQRIGGRIAEVLTQAGIHYPGQRLLWGELVIAAHKQRNEPNSTAEMGVWQLEALVRFHEPKGGVLHDLDALLPAHRMLHALGEALQGKGETLKALIGAALEARVGAPVMESAAELRASAAAAVEALTVGFAQRGGVTQTEAGVLAEKLFDEAGITVSGASAVSYFKRFRKARAKGTGNLAADVALFRELIAALPNPLPKHWPIEERKAWVRQLADGLGRRMGT